MNIKKLVNNNWYKILKSEFDSDYFKSLISFLEDERKSHYIFPPEHLIFNAFNNTSFDTIKVVIIGQDPYHGYGQANGLAFSVNGGLKLPPSLKNIFKEIESDLGHAIPDFGDLTPWAKQGVLLLNATLTVRARQAASHQKKGWETFTDNVIRILSEKKENLVFLLWGNFAQAKENLIDTTKHYILKAAHPSPFSARNGFFGCKHFSQANEILKKKGLDEINWQIKNPLVQQSLF